ncbi:MAG: adenylosuccinate synthase [Deltaproteobacteria bacterium]|nr:adenylosuccinate synthase [Deltaproteobacteria bacterium]MBI3078910.1 adenylosuccinate synthase [Deltaproteobacteria bacterium]
MANVVVVGAQWGDEGKGKVVDLLTEYADVVVRFQGGANAGHTLVVEGETLILHLVPSGVLYPGKLCIIGDGVVVDPRALIEEMDGLRARGLLRQEENLLVSERAHMTLPYHRLVDTAREAHRGARRIGTTGRGIGPTYEDKIARVGIRFADLLDEEIFTEKLKAVLEERNAYLVHVLQQPQARFEAICEEYLGYARRLRPLVANTSLVIDQAMRQGKGVLFEGAQGTHLDVDHGTYPFVTSSNTVAGAACVGSGIGPTRITAVVGICKAYTTRVGEGPFPTELHDDCGGRLREDGQEYGATTGRPRRCGWFDAVLVRDAVRLNGLTGLALTKLDVLTGFPDLRVCTAYRYRGETFTEVPANFRVLEGCEPIYEELPGWDVRARGARRFEELPVNAQRYVRRLEEHVGAEFCMISVGPGRTETILLKNPFGQ